MKHKWILITLSILFFLTAVTIYVNKVIFPNVVKKIAIEQAEKFLKRKVEIEDIRFNWMRGVVINKIKIYQKDSTTDVLAQAQKISAGFIFIPGTKQHKLNIPSLNIEDLSLHIIHQNNNQWNFSDLLVAKSDDKPSPVAVSLGGINVTHAKLRLDDLRPEGLWTEIIDPINLKLGLSLGGIAFDGSMSIPQKQGLISINGSYQPLNQSLKASLNLKNIKPLDYLNLIPVKLPFTLTNGTIEHINAQVQYAPNNMDIKGDWSLKNIDLSMAQESIKTDMSVANSQISMHDGTIKLKGQFSLVNTKLLLTAFSLSGALKANVDEFHMKSPQDITVKGSVQTEILNVKLPKDQMFQGQISAQITQGRWQNDSAAIEGDMNINQGSISLGTDQNINGDLKLTEIKLTKDKKALSATVNLGLNNMDVQLPKKTFKGNLNIPHLSVNLDNQNNLQASGSIHIDGADILMEKTTATGSLHLNTVKMNFNQEQQILDTKIQGVLEKINVRLDESKALSMDAHIDLHANYPLKNPKDLDYSGSVAVKGARFEGLAFGPLTNMNLTADFKTNKADIQNLELTLLDTPLQASGQVINFTKPLVNVQVSIGTIDLSKAKEIAPELLKTHGLKLAGQITDFKLKYEGMALDPSSAKINGEGILKNVDIESSTLKQSLKNISGSIKASGDSISWDNFTADYAGKNFVLTGKLVDFKNPKVTSSLSSNGIELNAEIEKTGDLLEIKNVAGHYLSAQFQTQGSVDLSSKTPQLDLKNKAQLKLEDLPVFMPHLKTTLDPLKLTGLLTVDAAIKGPATDWPNWISTASIQSDAIEAMGLKFSNIAIKLNQSQGKIQNCTLSSNAYQGTINIISNVDLTNKNFPADIGIKVNALDVASILKDLKVVQDIRGKFNLTTHLNLELMKPLELTGKGTLSVLEAYLADVELFKGILSPLKAIITTSNLILNEVTGNFSLAQQKVNTNDLQLKGNIMTLVAKGWVGFDQSLEMSIEVPDEYNQDSPIPADIRQSIRYTISGKLSKPKVQTNFSEVKTIINVGKKILGDKIPQGVSEILNSLPF